MMPALRALLVEDSEQDAELALLELKRHGYDVTHERVQTAAALREALRQPFDIVLSDYSMPGFDGIEALRIMKESGRELPFIIVSGTIGEETAVLAMQNGAYDFLLKGQLRRLGPAVERSLREHAARVARREAEVALRESEVRFRAMFEQAAVGMARVGLDERLLEVNQRLCHIVGYPRSELLGRTLRDLTHPEDVDADLDAARRLRAGEIETYSLEKRYLRKAGGVVWVDLTMSLVRDDAGPRHFVSVVQDISARKAAEAEAQMAQRLRRANEELQAAYRDLQATQAQLVHAAKMASLGELVAGVAHEVNNPLAFAMSHLDTVRNSLEKFRGELDFIPSAAAQLHWQKAYDRLGEVVLGLARIRDLVLKLRTFSRLDEGERSRVKVSECVEAVLTILGHSLKDRIAIETEFAAPDLLECYPALLNQALLNLIANSVDAIEGAGTISVKTAFEGADCVITIADSGCGIAHAIRDRVFEPFFTTKPVGKGTGLGLSITHSIVEKHRGTLTLSDAPRGGTIATLRLPVDHRE